MNNLNYQTLSFYYVDKIFIILVNHPIGVANILYFEGDIKDLITIQAAILHDTGNIL